VTILPKSTNSKRNYSSPYDSDLLLKFIKENNLNPAYLYNDLSLYEIRTRISKDLKGLSGVYMIFNKITGDYYVGSASTGKFYTRYCNHLIHLTGSKILKNAVKKYGIKNFSFVVLELFPEIVNKENNKRLLDIEDFYLKSLLPNYNILTEAGSSFGYKHTELFRIKMADNYSLGRREKIGELNRHKNLSKETIEKIREKALNKGPVWYSEKALMNMKKKSKPVTLYNLDKTVFGEYSSIVQAAISVNCSEKTIIRALQTERKILKRRFIVEYK
jgi:group I intron endonuclease